MIDSKETDKESAKAVLKNKRAVKGTPLHRYASRYACYIALSLGCAHLSVGYIAYYADVDDYWLKSGPEYISRKVVQLGIHERHDQDTQMKIDDIKENFKHSYGYVTYTVVSQYLHNLKERYFSSSPVDAASEPSETTKGASTPTSQSPNSSAIKDKSQ